MSVFIIYQTVSGDGEGAGESGVSGEPEGLGESSGAGDSDESLGI